MMYNSVIKGYGGVIMANAKCKGCQGEDCACCEAFEVYEPIYRSDDYGHSAYDDFSRRFDEEEYEEE